MLNNKSKSWRNALLPRGSTIQQAIRCLEMSGVQIVLVISEQDVLIGTLTDGDIRRAFLKGFSLDSSIDGIINTNPLVVPPEIGRKNVLKLMQANKIHQLPVISGNGYIEGLHLWDSVLMPDSFDNLFVIMAGGRGTRLDPQTRTCPKPMLEVCGKPMLEHIIERARLEGFRNFAISINYLGHMIKDYFGSGKKWDVSIEYLHEESPLGTAGSLSLLPSSLFVPFVVTNGDVLTDIRYSDILDFHSRNLACATMAVRQYELQNQYGVVNVKGIEIQGFEEKPIYRSHINAGIYVLDPGAKNYLKVNEYCDMPTLFERISLNSGLTIVYPMHEPWLDVGRPDDLTRAQNM